MTINFTEEYNKKGYAIYLPSLQKQYAFEATKTNAETSRGAKSIPKNFDNRWLNFLDQENQLWHCGYTLYSCGQFAGAQIRNRDIVTERDPASTVIIGDSGGFQLGTGAITNSDEFMRLRYHQHDPDAQYENWHQTGFKERTLKWLERYTDYAMTLDMVLWAAEEIKNPLAAKSQIRKLSAEQLIELSVDNLKYFSDYRGREVRTTKFLSVLQDAGKGTGEAWYQAVKDFEFEGWALGGDTGGILNSMKWLRRLLYDKKLDKSEWVHTLMKSPPVHSVVYTAAQKALRKVLGRDNFTISLDSSSPFQLSGVNQKLANKCEFSSKPASWKIGARLVPQDIRLARNELIREFPEYSPFAQYLKLNDLMAHDIDDSDYFTDTWSLQIMANHNMYMFHRNGIDACDLVFDPEKQDHGRVPEKLLKLVELIGRYFEAEAVGNIEDEILMTVGSGKGALGNDKV